MHTIKSRAMREHDFIQALDRIIRNCPVFTNDEIKETEDLLRQNQDIAPFVLDRWVFGKMVDPPVETDRFAICEWMENIKPRLLGSAKWKARFVKKGLRCSDEPFRERIVNVAQRWAVEDILDGIRLLPILEGHPDYEWAGAVARSVKDKLHESFARRGQESDYIMADSEIEKVKDVAEREQRRLNRIKADVDRVQKRHDYSVWKCESSDADRLKVAVNMAAVMRGQTTKFWIFFADEQFFTSENNIQAKQVRVDSPLKDLADRHHDIIGTSTDIAKAIRDGIDKSEIKGKRYTEEELDNAFKEMLETDYENINWSAVNNESFKKYRKEHLAKSKSE